MLQPSFPSAIPSHPPHSSGSSSFDIKRHTRTKELQFLRKYGHRHHSYDNEKAPYPLSYDKHVLEMEALDNRLTQHLRGSSSFVNFDESPARVLDLGCGTGTWVVDAAKEWPNAEFVGFDLVNVQVPLKLLDPSIAKRITWRHGNFLTTKLPFEDDEFDFVHIRSISKGVPESKWDVLFEEINRVLLPGGAVEIVEEDLIFPVLPRWFTGALRSRSRRPSTPTDINGNPVADIPPHDHALLESLMKAVFENRFINTTPTALLPSYFTTYFRQVVISPVITFPMPTLQPLLPLPSQVVTSYVIEPSSNSLEKRVSTISPAMTATGRPMSFSFSSGSTTSTLSTFSQGPVTVTTKRPRTASASLSSSTWRSTTSTLPVSETPPPTPPFKPFLIETPTESDEFPASLFPADQLSVLSERSLAMHLYRSYQTVLACQEAMWEELKDRIRNRKEGLRVFGWEDDEELEELQSRKRFEKLIERFKSDMHIRISLWTSLTNFGWNIPTREPLSKAELIEEERIRESMSKASQFVTMEEIQAPCRSVRVLVGYKL
ncbi:hypothetical protein CC2G_000646 [Coprinopsis cinerea AmutBmut pab1-1]|nr:hypothetical protein CC2G_000646 [Coprinopsis cinerea AmutBmut pab1-1]